MDKKHKTLLSAMNVAGMNLDKIAKQLKNTPRILLTQAQIEQEDQVYRNYLDAEQAFRLHCNQTTGD